MISVVSSAPCAPLADLDSEAQLQDIVRQQILHLHEGHDVRGAHDRIRKRHWWLHRKTEERKGRDRKRHHSDTQTITEKERTNKDT